MLRPFFKPKSVAIIGASTDPIKLGYTVVQNMVECGYPGKIYPINPKADQILGVKAYPSVKDIPDEVDLGVIVIPATAVNAALKECGEKGIHHVIVISAGFRETGAEGIERERELKRIAKEYNIRIIGPNVLGVIDTFTPCNASFSAGTPKPGPMAFMSQSGALGTAVLDLAIAGRIGISKFVSLGNKADLNEMELLKEWENDPESNVILIYCEELPQGQEFVRVAREVSKVKPIVAMKSGVTQSGSRAVSSHTGSLAGSEQAYQAAFRQAGVLRADSLQDLFDIANGLAFQPLLKGDRIAIVTNAGGPGILATDALERLGMTVARLLPETIRSLQEFLPPAASALNPVDVLGDALSDRYQHALELVSADPNVDGVMAVLTPQAMTEIEATAEVVADLASKIDKPIFGCFMGEARVKAGANILRSKGVPNYDFPENAALAFRAMWDYLQIRNRPLPEFTTFDVDKEVVQAVFQRVREEGRLTIGDAEAREIQSAYGLQIPKSMLAKTPDEAVEIATEIGYPVVLKIASPDILHKTDVGGVKVGLRNGGEVRDAFELMTYRAQRYVPSARLWGCLVQQMTPPGGLEILVGMNRDPQFGPLVTFGLGGIYVETLKDVTFRLAPFSRQEAEEMLKEIRAHALLDGVRGQPPVDKAAIVDILLRVGQLVQDFPEIVELDINPVMVYPQGQGAYSIDMRLVLSKSAAS